MSYNRGMNKEEVVHIYLASLVAQMAKGKKKKKNLPSMQETGSISQSGRSFREGNSNTLQYSCLENFMDRGAYPAIVHGVTKSQTQLSD